jgi:hypothetical protein
MDAYRNPVAEPSQGTDYGVIRDDDHPVIHAHLLGESSISLTSFSFNLSEWASPFYFRF